MVPIVSTWGASMAAALALLSSPAHAQSNTTEPCRAVANQQQSILKPSDFHTDAKLDAEMAYKCVTSVPFYKDEAATMIKHIKDYAQFHTNLHYVKEPPASYQQPAVDLIGRLDQIAEKAKNDEYKNQYEFDLDLATLQKDVHDGHYSHKMGIIGTFWWQLPGKNLVSVSSDGQEIPEVYVLSDIYYNEEKASPIVQIQGKNVFTYLQELANTTSFSFSDVHTEWNGIMWNPPAQFNTMANGNGWEYWPSYFEQSTRYRGKTLTGRFANGTDFEWEWVAATTWQLTENDMTSGKKLYTNVVANTESNSTIKARSANKPDIAKRDGEADLRAFPFPNYPRNPVVLQQGFGHTSAISGYVLDNGIGVLSMPSFEAGGDTASSASFNNAISKWQHAALKANVTKVVIDVSGNGGGSVFTGFNTFKQFFPTIEPSILHRTRATPFLDTMGTVITGVFLDNAETLPPIVLQDAKKNWSNMMFLNAWLTRQSDDKVWSSWEDYFGPNEIDGDEFTNNFHLNLAAPSIANEIEYNITGYGNNPATFEQPWAAEDIIILTDGSCGSTCSIFMEMMKTDAGVKSVSVGGIPAYGPMQGQTGTRGSNVQTWDTLSLLTNWVREVINEGKEVGIDGLKWANLTQEEVDSLPAPVSDMPWKVGYGAVNALDEIRMDDKDEPFPLQMTYEPTDCRLFWTPEMIRDVTKLWTAVAEIADGNMDACVPHSTKGPGLKGTLSTDPGFKGEDVWAAANTTDAPGGNERSSSDVNVDEKGDDDDSGALRLTTGLSSAVALMVALYIL